MILLKVQYIFSNEKFISEQGNNTLIFTMEAGALRMLQNCFKGLRDDPVEGFLCVPNEDNFFHWRIYIEGPKDTLFEGGIFELVMEFPNNFPMMPPSLQFVSEFWHPNVYTDGRVCISILHPPGEDAMSNELPGERWMPSQTVASILLSVISMLSDPNFSSPANVDASVEWRNNYSKYKSRVKNIVEKSRKRYENIKIPHPESNPDEKRKYLEKQRILNEDFIFDDYIPDEEFDVELSGNYDDFGVYNSEQSEGSNKEDNKDVEPTYDEPTHKSDNEDNKKKNDENKSENDENKSENDEHNQLNEKKKKKKL